MAKIQTKKINVNDFSLENKEDLGKLARSLNPFFDDIERAFRKGLSVEDNLPFQYITITAEVDGTGVPKQQVNSSFNLTNLKGCVIINAIAADGISFPTSAPFASYSITGSIIKFNHITGLPADKNFTLTLLLMA